MIFDRATRNLDVVEWDRVICELLIIFVTLACDQHNVAWTSKRNGAIDRLGAIDNFFVMIRTKAFFGFGDNRARVFLSRIIRGDDGVIAEAVRHLGHQRSFLPVAIAATTKNRNQSMRLEFPQSLQNVGQRIRSVCVIHEHLKLSFSRNEFQAPGDLGGFPQTQDGASQINSQSLGGSERSDGIRDVEPANQWKTDEVALPVRIKLIRGASEFRSVV